MRRRDTAFVECYINGIGRSILAAAVLWIGANVALQAQHRYGNWVHRNASDTTWVRCHGDSASVIGFPPGCFGPGHMFPDSLYCRFELMPLDSLPHPHDSAFIHWRRIRMGSDSGNYDFVNHHGMGSGMHHRGFQRQIRYRWRWDSSLHDTAHRRWRPRRVLCWNGDQWVAVDNAEITDSTINFSLADVYSSIAVVGEPEGGAGVDDRYTVENRPPWPNPASEIVHVPIQPEWGSTGEVRLFNSLGTMVRSFRFNGANRGHQTMQLDLSGLSPGVYYYDLPGDRSHTTGSVVVR